MPRGAEHTTLSRKGSPTTYGAESNGISLALKAIGNMVLAAE